MKLRLSGIASTLIVAGLGASLVHLSYAQEAGPTNAQGDQASHGSKEQRKAARAQARAKKNAELKKLEDAGYNPSRGNDPHYPQDLQNAQKKVGKDRSASQ
ncbi:hypothetical protein AWB76_06880 [Caballeronia temeraria]|uniref:Purine nucleoside phosphorylase n=1 Tax=Caballeronia temeraria TaxID=1777137 RepID=A0A158DH37_9BURK|nr:DUF4148 domain-containing protein [Caballeronia temeraria]SAK93117.1 hypothetical protein AWB76_06880 [Caballeronia temeraria]